MTVNILAIENDIVSQLETLAGIDKVYREPDSDDFDADGVDRPVLLVQNGGYSVEAQDGAGCYSSQKLNSIWIISVICNKDDYLTQGSIIMMDMISKMKGFKGVGWRKRMKIANDVKDFAKPVMGDRVAMYPMFFGVEVIV